jgi:3alpha(or 20beta)-hydroxysteroid dehydrogenase
MPTELTNEENSMGRLDDKIVVITGGARGQGAEEGRLFATEGATVVLTDVLDDEGRRAAAAIQRAEYVHLDVRSESEWEKTIDTIVERHGRVDVLVNNAGVDLAKRFEQTTLDEWQRLVAINQTGVFLGMRTVARAMLAAHRGGSIINISSVAGLEGVKGRAAYGSTKWAVTRAKAERNIPLGRVGQALDIAYMALFLASDESAYCTGQEFVVDGGVHH